MQAGIWRHNKTGSYYQVLGVGRYTDDEEGERRCVVYVSLSGIRMPGPRISVRPLEEWGQASQCLDGEYRPRFEYVGDELPEEFFRKKKLELSPTNPDGGGCANCGNPRHYGECVRKVLIRPVYDPQFPLWCHRCRSSLTFDAFDNAGGRCPGCGNGTVMDLTPEETLPEDAPPEALRDAAESFGSQLRFRRSD